VILSNDEDGPVTDLMTQPGAVFGQSDAGAHVAQLCDANMPTELLAHWVRDRGALTLEHAVYKLTAERADLYGLGDRGIDHVLVNGTTITSKGESLVGSMRERPGQILRTPGAHR
jgi:N-acyl-D-aspartate/D-glutamate deacylase